MPEESAAVETQAPESSPAPSTEIPRGGPEYTKWRMTGELPGDKPKADSTPADSEKTAAPEAEKTTPEKQPQRRAGGADERLREILSDLKQAGLTPSELKTYKKAAQREEREPEPRPAAREAAAPLPPSPQTPQAPKKPKYEDFGDWEKYEAAKDQYTEDLTEYKTQLAISKYQAEQAQRESAKMWNQKLSEASERYGAEAESAIVDTARTISQDAAIHPAVKAVLDDSKVLTDLLYVMGSDANALNEFVALARLNPGAAIRKAVLLERLVEDELAKGGKANGVVERGEDGKFVAAAPPAKKVNPAPPPPKEVSGKSGPPPDEAETAWKAGDFRNYREVANRRDIQKMKGQ